MNWFRTALLVLCIGCTSCALQPTKAPDGAFGFTEHLGGKSLLFVGAHPDDEWGVAPMFAEACLFNGASCHFVVASEAKSFGCYMTIDLKDPEECSKLRREEMLRSARMLGGDVTFFGWEDIFYSFDQAGMERNLTLWERDNGGRAALVARLKGVLDAVKPDVVFALDPRHGTTCHPNHRAVTLLLLEAIDQGEAGGRPEVWFENDFVVEDKMDATTKSGFEKGAIYPWPGDTAPMYWYDASKILPNGKSGFDYLVSVMKTHATQFPDVANGTRVLDPPAELQRVPFTRLQDINPAQDMCTSLALERPTVDKYGYPPTD